MRIRPRDTQGKAIASQVPNKHPVPRETSPDPVAEALGHVDALLVQTSRVWGRMLGGGAPPSADQVHAWSMMSADAYDLLTELTAPPQGRHFKKEASDGH